MGVWKKHGIKPPQTSIEVMQNKAKELFGHNITFRTQMKRIPNHFHFHVNPKCRAIGGQLLETDCFPYHFRDVFRDVSNTVSEKKADGKRTPLVKASF